MKIKTRKFNKHDENKCHELESFIKKIVCHVSAKLWIYFRQIPSNSNTTATQLPLNFTKFDKNISNSSLNCADPKNGINFYIILVEWPKIAVKKALFLKKF